MKKTKVPKINHWKINGNCYLYKRTTIFVGPCKKSKVHSKKCPHKNEVKK